MSLGQIYQSHYAVLVAKRNRLVEEIAEINAQIITLRQEARLANVELACST